MFVITSMYIRMFMSVPRLCTLKLLLTESRTAWWGVTVRGTEWYW